MKNFSLILSLLTFACTTSQEQIMRLKGKIVVERSNGISASLYFQDEKRTVPLRYDRGVSYGGLHWANTSDTFVGVVQFSNRSGRVTRGSIASFDVNGQVIDTIYQAHENELTGNAYLSPKDDKLLFTLEIDHYDPAHPLDQLNRSVSIIIMDFRSKVIIDSIPDVGSTPAIYFYESPWLKDEAFIFNVRGDRKFVAENEETVSNDIQEGIYLYNLRDKSTTLLAEGGVNGIVSPVSSEIAYMKSGQIWIYDIRKKTTRSIYKAKRTEKVTYIHWAPDGEHIFLSNYNELPLDSFFVDEKLIRSDDGTEISFDKTKSPGPSCTWK